MFVSGCVDCCCITMQGLHRRLWEISSTAPIDPSHATAAATAAAVTYCYYSERQCTCFGKFEGFLVSVRGNLRVHSLTCLLAVVRVLRKPSFSKVKFLLAALLFRSRQFTYLLTHLHTHWLTYILTDLLTHLVTHLLTHVLHYILTYSLTHLLTQRLTYFLPYPLTSSLTYLPTYLVTYLHTHWLT